MSVGTVCKRAVFISTLNFLSAENDTNLFIESSTLRDVLLFRICIEKYPYIQVIFLCTNLLFVFCATLEYGNETVNFTQCFDNFLSLKLDSNVVKNITTMFKKSLDPFRIICITQTD